MKCAINKKLIWILSKVLEPIYVKLCTLHHELNLWHLFFDRAKCVPEMLVRIFGHDVSKLVDVFQLNFVFVGEETFVILHDKVIVLLVLSRLFEVKRNILFQWSVFCSSVFLKLKFFIKPMVDQNCNFLIFTRW